MEVASSILYSVVANTIYDIGKRGLGRIKTDKELLNKTDIEEYVLNELGKKYVELSDSAVLCEYLKSPLVMDTICIYTEYVIDGIISPNFMTVIYKDKKRRNKQIEESDIISYLTDNLLKKYTAQGVVSRPDNHLIEAFFKDLIAISSNYIAGQLKLEEKALAYYINRRIGRFDSEVSRKLNEIESILKKSIATEIVYTDERLQHDKENYTKLLKGKHKEAHIYLLDKFDLQDFYVPPFLNQDMGDRWSIQWYLASPFSARKTSHVFVNNLNWKTERINAIKLDKESVIDFDNRLLRLLSESFYTDIYYSNHSLIDDLSSLSESEWFELGKKAGADHRTLSRGWSNYKSFLKIRTKSITAVEPATENGNEK